VPKETTPAGIRRSTPSWPLVSVPAQFDHVVFHLLEVPLFGREEDAADQFSAYMMLLFGADEARRLIGGTAYMFKRDIAGPQATLELRSFSDTHGTPAQRFYNVLCIAFGADAKLFGDLPAKGYLPWERAIWCEDEYRQVARAFTKLIGPHIDEALARQVMAKKWLPDVSTKPPAHPQSGGKVRPLL
jgi:hypothetical protein